MIIGLVVPANSWARTEARYEYFIGNTVIGDDLGFTTCKQTLFHQQTLNNVDNEDLGTSFPTSLSLNAPEGSSTGASIALPSISQSTYQSSDATSTGFYNANFLSIPPVNNGAAPVMAGLNAPISPVAAPTSLIGSSMMYPEMENTIPGNNLQKALAKTPADDSSKASSSYTSSLKSIPLNSASV